MSYTKNFKDITKKDVNIVGGKGASLGEMTAIGLPVPEGFVVLADAFDRFLEETQLMEEVAAALEMVNSNTVYTAEEASEKIKGLILSKEIPDDIKSEILMTFKNLGMTRVAVRSSATLEDGADHAWAGQLESYLNVTEEELLEKVKSCWTSLFTPRAIFYRLEKGLQTSSVSVAVVIQKMVNSEKSGIAFSVHPITEDPNQIMIEAASGLGDLIVSGAVIPDGYVVSKDELKMIDRGIQGNISVLSDTELVTLSGLVIKIENHYGFPCDIEWAFENGNFYIVQSRPITTLGKNIPFQKSLFHKGDYMLSFWVQGVSVFVTDIHLDAYRELEVLYIIDDGMFKQYFTNKAYEQALDRGLEFYSDEYAFDNYQKDLSIHCESFKKFFEQEVENKKALSRDIVGKFFEYTRKLCGDYAKMNFEFTDKAFQNQEENPTIKKNLAGVAVFKDQVRVIMNKVLFEPGGYTSTVFSILGKQFRLDSALFDNLTQLEVSDLFEGKKPNEDVVIKRQKAFVENHNLSHPYEGEEAELIIREFKEYASGTDTIYGQVASKGRVTGKVKIIPVDYGNLARVHAEIEKMKQGDILVAETTAPELIIACKKAGAIVTDMGGLMSHAAIVSREFSIPCIVGTKNASKILKDGDMVEVDAEKGVIRLKA